MVDYIKFKMIIELSKNDSEISSAFQKQKKELIREIRYKR